jgi:hypothetical protein
MQRADHRVLLVHITRVTLLALIAWSKSKQIPGYINSLIQTLQLSEHLCQCTEGFKISCKDEPDDKETITFEAPPELLMVYQMSPCRHQQVGMHADMIWESTSACWLTPQKASRTN